MHGTRLLVTTVVRHAPAPQPSGYGYVLDSASRQRLVRWPVFETAFRRFDPNPRGGLRGARGVAVYGDLLAVANTDEIAIYGSDGRPVRRITHPLLGGVHDLLAEDDGIWIACAHADLLVKMSWRGRLLDVWDWRAHAGLAEQLRLPGGTRTDLTRDYRDPRTLRGRVCNLVHLNGVSRGRTGLLLSFGRIASLACRCKLRLDVLATRCAGAVGARRCSDRMISSALGRLRLARPKFHGCSSAIVELSERGEPRVLRRTANAAEPNHNIVQLGNRLVYCDTNNHCVVAFTPDGSRPECRTRIPGSVPFVRGLAPLGEHRVLVGSQAPAALYEVDLNSGRVEAQIDVSTAAEAVYGVCVLPAGFSIPNAWPGMGQPARAPAADMNHPDRSGISQPCVAEAGGR